MMVSLARVCFIITVYLICPMLSFQCTLIISKLQITVMWLFWSKVMDFRHCYGQFSLIIEILTPRQAKYKRQPNNGKTTHWPAPFSQMIKYHYLRR